MGRGEQVKREWEEDEHEWEEDEHVLEENASGERRRERGGANEWGEANCNKVIAT